MYTYGHFKITNITLYQQFAQIIKSPMALEWYICR